MRKWKDLEERGLGKERWKDDGREWVRERKRESKRERKRERGTESWREIERAKTYHIYIEREKERGRRYYQGYKINAEISSSNFT